MSMAETSVDNPDSVESLLNEQSRLLETVLGKTKEVNEALSPVLLPESPEGTAKDGTPPGQQSHISNMLKVNNGRLLRIQGRLEDILSRAQLK